MTPGMLSTFLFLFVVYLYFMIRSLRSGQRSKILDALPSAIDGGVFTDVLHDRVYNNRYNPYYRKYVRQHMQKGFFGTLTKFFSRRMDVLVARLMKSGMQGSHSVEELISLKVISFLAALVCMLLFLLTQSLFFIILFVGFIYFALVGIEFILARKVNKRHEKIRKELPEFLTLLKEIMETGVSIQRGIEIMVAKFPGILASEFQKAIVDSQANGGNWALAIENMGLRVDLEELSTVLNDILLSYKRGTEIIDVVHEQAKEMRENYTVTIEEKSRSMSVKLLIPLMIFNFGPLFLLLLVPMILKFMGSFQ